ncbi:MAG: flagellar biosynthetic protein FliR [Alphaproteobacteria bacterium]|nr:flagellar biosynthetic protein FliR [Alphaproteobacteria bacterium]
MSDFFATQFYYYLLVAFRLFPIFLFAPGFGEKFVLPQIRVFMTILVAIFVQPLVQDYLPAQPIHFFGLVLLLSGELAIGLFLAFISRLFIYLLESAGAIIAQVIGFSNALSNSPVSAQQASIISAFLSLTGLLLIFTLSLHHLFIYGTIDSYAIFKPGFLPPLAEFSDHFVQMVSKTFKLSVYFAAPFLVVSLIFYLGMGILSRLVTQIQIFFIAAPLQLLIGTFVLFLCLATLFSWYELQIKENLGQVWRG